MPRVGTVSKPQSQNNSDGPKYHYPACALRALGLLLAYSGTGRDFLARNGMSRTKTAVTRKRSDRDGRVQRQNGANGEGYKRHVDKKRGPISKTDFRAEIRNFWPEKNDHFLILTMFRPRPGGVVKRKKYPFPK